MWRVLLLAGLLSACTGFPKLGDLVEPDLADERFPKLVPIEPILNAPFPTREEGAVLEDGLLDRVAALNARAAQLRGDVIDRRTRRRMERGIEPPAFATDG